MQAQDLALSRLSSGCRQAELVAAQRPHELVAGPTLSDNLGHEISTLAGDCFGAQRPPARDDRCRRQAAVPRAPCSRSAPAGPCRTSPSATYANRPLWPPLCEPRLRRVPGLRLRCHGSVRRRPCARWTSAFPRSLRGRGHDRRGRDVRTGLTAAARSGRSVSPRRSSPTTGARRARSGASQKPWHARDRAAPDAWFRAAGGRRGAPAWPLRCERGTV